GLALLRGLTDHRTWKADIKARVERSSVFQRRMSTVCAPAYSHARCIAIMSSPQPSRLISEVGPLSVTSCVLQDMEKRSKAVSHPSFILNPENNGLSCRSSDSAVMWMKSALGMPSTQPSLVCSPVARNL